MKKGINMKMPYTLHSFIFRRKLDLIHFKTNVKFRLNQIKYWSHTNFVYYEYQDIKENMSFKNVTLFIILLIVSSLLTLYTLGLLVYLFNR